MIAKTPEANVIFLIYRTVQQDWLLFLFFVALHVILWPARNL